MRDKLKIINCILKSNFEILENSYKKEKTVITMPELEKMGYTQACHTHQLYNKQFQLYALFCYTYGIIKINGQQFKILYNDLHL